MQTVLYNFGLAVLRLLLPIMGLVNKKARSFYKGRKNLLDSIEKSLSKNGAPIFWMHCASVGEFEQGLPILELIKKEHPNYKALVTFFSPSGFEAISNSLVDYKFYLPYDTPGKAQKFVEMVNPKLALFVKYEYWYHFLKQLQLANIPTFAVASIFRTDQPFFKWYGSWHRQMLKRFTYFGVQDEASMQLLHQVDLYNASVTGDTRMDRVLFLKHDSESFDEVKKCLGTKKILVIGSLRKEDDRLILPFIKQNKNYAYIIAPHDIVESHIKKIESYVSNTVRYSQLQSGKISDVLILDTIGKLSRIYKLAYAAYVGGGFSDGIHNILEPAVYEIPVFFGSKNYKKYKEAVDLINLGGAFPIKNETEFKSKLSYLEQDQNYNKASREISHYVKLNDGAASKMYQLLKDYL